jgi:hypothetical protein
VRQSSTAVTAGGAQLPGLSRDRPRRPTVGDQKREAAHGDGDRALVEDAGGDTELLPWNHVAVVDPRHEREPLGPRQRRLRVGLFVGEAVQEGANRRRIEAARLDPGAQGAQRVEDHAQGRQRLLRHLRVERGLRVVHALLEQGQVSLEEGNPRLLPDREPA